MLEMKLYDNALSSLHEGLRCWQQGADGDKERYKFAILHISRFFELSLKYTVYVMHPLLVYKKPYAKNLGDELTISPQEAFYIIKNSDTDSLGAIEFDDKEIEPLNRLKKIRNSIEHFVYDLPPEEIRADIVLFLETACSMMSDRADTYFPEHLDEDVMKIYRNLIEEN